MKNRNRAEAVEEQFLTRVKNKDFPAQTSGVTVEDARISKFDFVEMFESQIMSRLVDIEARELRKTNDSYYTIGSSGHEGNVVFGKVFKTDDMAFLHYRSGAMFIQRQRQIDGSTPLYDTMLSIVASENDPIAQGRHKVWGSVNHMVPPQTSTIASHLPKAVGAALSIHLGDNNKIEKAMHPQSVVFCNFGDASANHSTALGAINHAAWWAYQNVPVPLVFVCEDNGLGISVPTPQDWIASTFRERPGMKYVYADGLHLPEAYAGAEAAAYYARTFQKPVFLHMRTIRMLGHAGSDVETLYHSQNTIEQTEANDPLLHSARIVVENQWLSPEEIVGLYEQTKLRLRHIGRSVAQTPKLTDPNRVEESVVPKVRRRPQKPILAAAEKEELFGKLKLKQMGQKQHMAKLLNWGLYEVMGQYPEAVTFGEDVAKKGGVYHVTAGLHESFGQDRVFNTLLDEQSILGTAIGLSQNGFLPIPEIQFLAYLHNAEDQVRGEAATLSFFSNSQFTNPMVIRVAGLAYQKGFGGHFHNDNSLAVLRDIPGVVLACPSNGADAVRMLRTCVRQAHEFGRVCVMIEPIALYMIKDLLKEGDAQWSFEYPHIEEDTDLELGEFAVKGEGKDCAILTYGNGVYYSSQAIEDLKQEGIQCRLIDLRWLSDLKFDELAKVIEPCGSLLIVDECRHTGSQSEQLFAELRERLPVRIKIHRETARDCFIPLGKGATCVLPSRESIAEKVKSISQQKVEVAREPRRVRVTK